MSNLVIGCNVFYHSSLSFICILTYSILCIFPFYYISMFSKVCIVCYPVLLYFFIKVFSHSSFLCIVFLCIPYIFSLSTTIRYFPKSSVCVILFFLYYSIVFLHPSIYVLILPPYLLLRPTLLYPVLFLFHGYTVR